ncbi:MAG: type II toxin-antitoxin system RelE/ParE family toxin [Rhodospirillaceae bacterium]|nr:type II toxin-antitoxin system RelE/ParE family toxin [Rhodospirillaceae bacterium]
MITSFRHKGLKLLFETGERRKLPADRVDKIERILARLDEATDARHMDLPGYRLHPLKGDLAGFWSVGVSGNWRIIFRMENGNARDIDLVDYH